MSCLCRAQVPALIPPHGPRKLRTHGRARPIWCTPRGSSSTCEDAEMKLLDWCETVLAVTLPIGSCLAVPASRHASFRLRIVFV